jgi:hypothetical protein
MHWRVFGEIIERRPVAILVNKRRLTRRFAGASDRLKAVSHGTGVWRIIGRHGVCELV